MTGYKRDSLMTLVAAASGNESQRGETVGDIWDERKVEVIMCKPDWHNTLNDRKEFSMKTLLGLLEKFLWN